MKALSNKILFRIHGWLGLNIGLLLFVICFSGTFAVLSNEMDWLLNPAVRAEAQDKSIAWEAMYQNIKAAYPGGKITSLMEQKNPFTEVGDYFATAAIVVTPQDEVIKLHFDPYTGKLQGQTVFLDIQRFFRSYHNNFSLPIKHHLVKRKKIVKKN
ncbi:MAG: PepSY-associated TM helix domain-containing protein [Bacteroidota bacterium]